MNFIFLDLENPEKLRKRTKMGMVLKVIIRQPMAEPKLANRTSSMKMGVCADLL